MWFCRAMLSPDGVSYYPRYTSLTFYQITHSFPQASDFSTADSQCKAVGSNLDAVDVQIIYATGDPFVFSQIDPGTMADAVAAGFILSYGLIALAWGGRIIIKSIFPNWRN